jgi:thiopurine S-methyltransferase
MDSDFWHQRWQRGETGWHLEHVNPLLAQSWPQLGIAPGARIFVPLCGKSEDLAWLARQGYRVVGVELSGAAVRAFFAEHGWTADIAKVGGVTRFRSGPVDILCGDYFDIGPGALGSVDAVYDRGALVALPPAMRERYVDHLRDVLPIPLPTLLITLDYPPHEMNGPPFPVSETDVTRYFGATHATRLLAATDALANSPGFRERGVTEMTENVFALTPRSAVWP